MNRNTGAKKKKRSNGRFGDFTHVILRGDHVVLVGGVPRWIAAQEDLSSVESQGVLESIEHFRGHQISREEYAGAVERSHLRRNLLALGARSSPAHTRRSIRRTPFLKISLHAFVYISTKINKEIILQYY